MFWLVAGLHPAAVHAADAIAGEQVSMLRGGYQDVLPAVCACLLVHGVAADALTSEWRGLTASIPLCRLAYMTYKGRYP